MNNLYWMALLPALWATAAMASDDHQWVDKPTLESQNSALNKNTENKGYGPQSPRDLTRRHGTNQRVFSAAPTFRKMNLCNIHFHENAEHKGGEFTTFAGEGDGHGYHTVSAPIQI